MKELRDEGCCEHKNCFITFDMKAPDPDLFTYFIIDDGKDQGKKENETEEQSWARAVELDLIYVFCQIHSQSLVEYMEEMKGHTSIAYIESIVKDPHFGDSYGR